MFKKSLALAIMSAFVPSSATVPMDVHARPLTPSKPGKGQLRQCKSKPSGAAALKRAAKKRANIRKHK